jgi:hypothetical protein
LLVIDIHAVEGDICLIAAAAIDGAVARVGIGLAEVGSEDDVGIASVGDTGLQTEQCKDIASLQGQLDNAVALKGVSHCSIGSIEGRPLAGHFHLLLQRTEVEPDVEPAGRTDLQGDGSAFEGLKSGRRDDEAVFTGGQLGKAVDAIGTRFGLPLAARCRAFHRNLGCSYGLTLGIVDLAPQIRSVLLPEAECCQRETQPNSVHSPNFKVMVDKGR